MSEIKERFNLIGKSNFWMTVSLLIIVVSFLVIGVRFFTGKPMFNMGIDFTGGTSIVIRFEQVKEISSLQNEAKKAEQKRVFLGEVREVLRKFNLEQSSIQFSTGQDAQSSDLAIKTQPLSNETRQELMRALEERFGQMELIESDMIGPSIGEELAGQAIKIIILSSILLLIYITVRFELSFAVAAIVALFHDVLITLGISALFYFEINTAYVAAILTILGYSINDTIVVFDRIRENIPLLNKKEPYDRIANISINQSLARTINTSLTTLVVLLSIFVFGGDTIKNFALVLIVGIISGTYSSIFIASPILVKLKHWQDTP